MQQVTMSSFSNELKNIYFNFKLKLLKNLFNLVIRHLTTFVLEIAYVKSFFCLTIIKIFREFVVIIYKNIYSVFDMFSDSLL